MAAAASAPKQEADRIFSVNNPLTGVNGIAVFVALGVLAVVVDLLICCSGLALTNPSKIVSAQVFIVILLVGWVAFSMATNLNDFLTYAAVSVLLFSPLVVMTLLESDMFF